jgi:hypothetical protein
LTNLKNRNGTERKYFTVFFQALTVICPLGLMGALVTKHKEEEERGVKS